MLLEIHLYPSHQGVPGVLSSLEEVMGKRWGKTREMIGSSRRGLGNEANEVRGKVRGRDQGAPRVAAVVRVAGQWLTPGRFQGDSRAIPGRLAEIRNKQLERR